MHRRVLLRLDGALQAVGELDRLDRIVDVAEFIDMLRHRIRDRRLRVIVERQRRGGATKLVRAENRADAAEHVVQALGRLVVGVDRQIELAVLRLVGRGRAVPHAVLDRRNVRVDHRIVFVGKSQPLAMQVRRPGDRQQIAARRIHEIGHCLLAALETLPHLNEIPGAGLEDAGALTHDDTVAAHGDAVRLADDVVRVIVEIGDLRVHVVLRAGVAAVGEARDVAESVVLVRRLRRLAGQRLALVEQTIDLRQGWKARGGEVFQAEDRRAVGEVDGAVGVDRLEERAAEVVARQLAQQQSLVVIRAVAVGADDRAVQRVAGSRVADLLGHRVETVELALTAVVLAVRIDEGRQLLIGAVPDVTVEHRRFRKHPAVAGLVAGVAAARVVEIDSGAKRP